MKALTSTVEVRSVGVSGVIPVQSGSFRGLPADSMPAVRNGSVIAPIGELLRFPRGHLAIACPSAAPPHISETPTIPLLPSGPEAAIRHHAGYPREEPNREF